MKVNKTRLYIGCYTNTRRGPGGEGVYIYDMDTVTGELTQVSVYKDCNNPSFLSFRGDTILACEEVMGASSVLGLKINEDGTLSFKGRVTTEESGMCHITPWIGEDYVTVSNFNSGSLVTCGLTADGTPTQVTDFIKHEGSGPARMQQTAHVHSATMYPSKDRFLVCDLGNDTLTTYVMAEGGKLNLAQTVKMVPGSGPRHAAFSPDGRYLSVLTQLSNVIATYKVEDGVLGQQVGCISSIPADFTERSDGADIHYSADGKRVYASNRGHNSIIVCDAAEDGTLSNERWFSCHGESPRNFHLTRDGKRILIANQNSGNLVVVALDEKGDLAEKQFEAAIPQTVFVSEG